MFHYYSRLIVVGIAIIVSILAVSASAESLSVLYEAALESDPTMQEARANWQAAYEAKPQAISYLLPQINLNGRYEEDNFDGSNVILTTVEQSTNGDRLSWQLELTQPLFRWDRIAALQGANKVLAKADVDYQIAEQELILRVTERYFAALAAEDEVNSAVDNELAFARQLKQARKRFDVGLVTITAVHEAQAAADGAIAEAIAAKQASRTALERLRETVGTLPTTLARVVDDM
ncbi:MAG: TolC family protein, partial [Gammaproteobacteria bacterium]|nr:TolC family protein [Gammaproteobacteria bacterium]